VVVFGMIYISQVKQEAQTHDLIEPIQLCCDGCLAKFKSHQVFNKKKLIAFHVFVDDKMDTGICSHKNKAF
jgi:hypothetical protein